MHQEEAEQQEEQEEQEEHLRAVVLAHEATVVVGVDAAGLAVERKVRKRNGSQ